MADLDALGDEDGWTCWLCGDAVPRQARANDPLQPVADQIAPAAKGQKGRGLVRLAHKRCNDLRKARPPAIAWPERLAFVDGPDLLQSLTRLDKRAGKGPGEVVGAFVDADHAGDAAAWVVPVATTLFPGAWTASCEPMRPSTAVRLRKEG